MASNLRSAKLGFVFPVYALFSLALIVHGASANLQDRAIYNPDQPDNRRFVGEVVGSSEVFRIVQADHQKQMIQVYINGKLLYRLYDIPVIRRSNGKRFIYLPGTSGEGYHFYLSPNFKYLFVQRGLFSGYSVGYLYKASRQGYMSPVLFDAHRLDEASAYSYARSKKINFRKLTSAENDVTFQQWSSDSRLLVFNVSAASDWLGQKSRRTISGDWTVIVDLVHDALKTEPQTWIAET